MDLDDQDLAVRILLRDHDAKFTGSFDDVFGSAGGQVLCTPIRAPKANAYAERWIQTVRVECLDWTLVLGRAPSVAAAARLRPPLQRAVRPGVGRSRGAGAEFTAGEPSSGQAPRCARRPHP
jgi:hypothetical protein